MAGKRRAEKPGRSARSSSAPTPRTPVDLGSHTGGRKKLIPGLPSAPSLVGATALALAAVGALVSQQSTAPAAQGYSKLTSQATVLTASSSIASSNPLAGRARAVSRDSEREAQADAADAELQAAAETQAKKRNAALAALAASAEQHADELAANAWQLPVAAGVYHLTSRFGECSYLWSSCHTGLDFAAPSGTTIVAAAAGTVTETGYAGSYGNRTIVTLEDGTEMWYCHQNSYGVSVGQTVRPGDLIGYVGSTGNVTGPHLHLEVRPGAGDPVDPYQAFVVNGVTP